MNIQEFAEKARKQIAGILNCNVLYKEVEKLNGSWRHSIIILEPGSNIAPTLYLEPFYNMYLDSRDWKETINQIIVAYQADRFPKCLDMEWFKDFNKVQKLIFHKLINFEANKRLLEDIPYTRYLDFAIVYCVHFQNAETGNGSILIHNSHLDIWHCTTENLASLAIENTPQLYPLMLSTIDEAIKELTGCKENCADNATILFPFPMYVMSNNKKANGAISILYKDSLKNIADKLNSDVVILPCSVNEVILLALEENDNFQELKNMVLQVNRFQLAKEDFLSDNIYLYRRSTDNIEII
ncbi:MAG: DUF5688 family protein [Lachnospiraceae bacterium]|nr:DUF5688 family protein [Lachnospiraceae bacterium]